MSTVINKITLKDPELLRNQNYIDGKWVGADNGNVLEVRNPSTGELVGVVRPWAHRKRAEPSKLPALHCPCGVL